MDENINKEFDTVFDSLRRSLLDMGLKNNLLNFKSIKRSVSVVNANLIEVYDTLVLKNKKVDFVPKSNDDQEKDNTWSIPVNYEEITEESTNNTLLQTDITEFDLQKRLFSLFQYYKTSIEDLGYNNLFLALGFLEWKQSRDDKVYKAPLILIPVEISRSSIVSPFKIKWTGADVSFNLSLQHKLLEQNIRLPIYEKIKSQEDLLNYIKDVKKAIKKKKDWNVLNEVYLSTFSFKKLVMYNDLQVENWETLNESEISRLFGLSDIDEFDSFDITKIDEEIEPIDTYNVVDADSSQIAVIEDAKRGHSLVVEGPPGTGKSQTIVNLIAELLANDKKILFVSEKMAALEVVQTRMEASGLGDYCLNLHSNNIRNKEILDDLNKILLKERVNVSDFEDYDKLKHSRDLLNEYMRIIHTPYGNIGYSVYQLIGMYYQIHEKIAKENQTIYKFDLPDLYDVTKAEYQELLSNMDEISEVYKSLYPIKNNPWNYTEINYLSPDEIDTIKIKANQIDRKLDLLLDDIEDVHNITEINKPENFKSIDYFISNNNIRLSNKNIKEDLEKLEFIVNKLHEYQYKYDLSLNLSGLNLDTSVEEYEELLKEEESLKISADIIEQYDLEDLLSILVDCSNYIMNSPIQRALKNPEIENVLHTFKSSRKSFTKIFNKDYKKSRNELRGYYSEDVDDETMVDDFDDLLDCDYAINQTVSQIAPYLKAEISTDDIMYDLSRLKRIYEHFDTLKQPIEELLNKKYVFLHELKEDLYNLKQQKEDKKVLDDNDLLAQSYFESWDDINTDYKTLKKEHLQLKNFSENYQDHQLKLDEDQKTEVISKLDSIGYRKKQIYDDFEYINSYLNFKRELSIDSITSLTLTKFKDEIIKIKDNIQSLSNWSQLNTYFQSYENPNTKDMIELIRQDKIKPEEIVDVYKYNFLNNLLKSAFKSNEILRNFNTNIYEKNINQFKRLDLKAIELNKYRVQEILDKKRPDITQSIKPTSELGRLLHEMNKKRNHKPVRQLLKECANVVTDIKPCFLMSPLSIAQYLDSNIYESYFDYVIFDEASQVRIEDSIGALLRGKKYIIMGDTKQLPPTSFFDVETNIEQDLDEVVQVQDVESILHFCKTVLPYRMLKCHYRSRHESLIAVSNLEFYNNDLIIYPSPIIDSEDLGLKLVYNPDSVYERGTNRQNKIEAKEVVDYAFNHFKKYGNKKSLGIGTFSVAQKNAVLEEIEQRLKQDSSMESYFMGTDDNSFFVKNIENIQGDERDFILISVGYGYDADHKLSMSFGPLNNDGGERRLNVLTTRAKEKCIVFSNFKSSDMKVTPRTPKGVQVLKTYLYYAENKKFPNQYLDEEALNSEFEQSVYEFLVENGFKVAKQVGCAGYRVNLAVVDPDDDDEYILAIETDGTSYFNSSSARERDRLRQSILEGLGWNFHRIWSTDWYLNQDNAQNMLLNAIEKAILKSQERKQKLEEERLALEEAQKQLEEAKKEEVINEEDIDDIDDVFNENIDDDSIPDKDELLKEKSDDDVDDDSVYDEGEDIFEEDVVEEVSDKTDDSSDSDSMDSINSDVKSKITYEEVKPNKENIISEYEEYEEYIKCDDFYKSAPALIDSTTNIIRKESPIHTNQLYDRIKSIYGVKATKKFKNYVEENIKVVLGSDDSLYKKDDYFYVKNQPIVVRKRKKPNIDYISDDEIFESVKEVLGRNYSLSAKDLAKEVSVEFGFKAMSKKTSHKILNLINDKIKEGKLVKNDDMVMLNSK